MTDDFYSSQAQTAAPGQAKLRYCVGCGRALDWSAEICPYCGHDHRAAPPSPIEAPKSRKPLIAGLLMIGSAVLAVVMGIQYLIMDSSEIESILPTLPEGVTIEDIMDMLRACGVVVMIFGAIAVLGSVMAITRQKFGLAVAGSVFAILGYGYLVGSLLGIVALIILILSKDEFKKNRPAYI